MKKVLFTCLMASVYLTANANVNTNTIAKEIITQAKIDIKIKNDTGEAVQVYNAGSGGTYSLTKGATTTIKMEEGDKLHYYEKGKKGALILTASRDMQGKIQLLSKI
jgi:hypothetical protein